MLAFHGHKIRKAMLVGMVIGAVLILFAISGCSSTQIKKDRWIPLEAAQQHEGVEKAVDANVEYKYVITQRNDDGSGTIEISGRVVPTRKLDSLDVYLNFLDAEGKRIGVHSIYSPGAGRGAPKQSFQYTFDIPPDTRSIAFSFVGIEQRDVF